MPVAAILPAVIGAGASLGGAALQAGAAGKAADAGAQAQANTLAWEKNVYGQQQANVQPSITQGNAAGTELAGLLGTGGDPTASANAFSKYLGSTNYQFQLGQGLQGIQYANAPAWESAATAKALNNYAQGEAGSALQGYEAMLQGQQGLGLNAASSLGSTGVGAGSTINSANQAAANTIGGAAIYGANAGSSALQGLNTLLNQNLTQSSFGPNAFAGFGGGSAYQGPAGLQGLI